MSLAAHILGRTFMKIISGRLELLMKKRETFILKLVESDLVTHTH